MATKQRGTVRRIRLTFTDEVLGSQPGSKTEFDGFFRDRAARTLSEEGVKVDPETGEQSAYSADEIDELLDLERDGIEVEDALMRGKTVFPRDKQGRPCMYGYQIKGAFKDACGMLRRVKSSRSIKLKAYKKVIDGLIWVNERTVPFQFDGEMGVCSRPLRATTPQGERVAIACSETIPEGASLEFTVTCLEPDFWPVVEEWLTYFGMRGIGQWRNSGKGTCAWEYVD